MTSAASAICPLCHTIDSTVTELILDAGGGWQCALCQQRWTRDRLDTVAAYGRWVVEHDRERMSVMP